MAVTWRGSRFDPRTRDMLVELASKVHGYIQPSQGSYNTSVGASAGTHAGGGAVDIRCSNLTDAQEREVVLWGRRIGFAMWLRSASKSWPEHIHGIAIGCPDLSAAARDQVDDYRNGRDGLAANGPDTGPDVPFTTFEQYQAKEDDMVAPRDWTAADRTVVRELIGKEVNEQLERGLVERYDPATGKNQVEDGKDKLYSIPNTEYWTNRLARAIYNLVRAGVDVRELAQQIVNRMPPGSPVDVATVEQGVRNVLLDGVEE